MDLATLLRDLGPTRALRLFFIAFGLGLAAIVIDWGSISASVLLPSVPIVTYTWALYKSQATYFVSHSPGTKTSPYILGFLLTLIAVFNLFFRRGDDLVSGDIDINMLLGQVGAAILTTVVGLVARQILISTDSAEEQQQQVFQSLAGELRRNATEFDSAQRKLVSLIQEFVGAREELFSREELAFQKFLGGLERGSQILTEVETTFPKRLQSALSAMNKHIEALDQAVGDASRHVTDLCAAAKAGSDGITTTGNRVQELLLKSAQQWDQASRSLTSALTTSAGSMKHGATETAALRRQLSGIQEDLISIVQNLMLLPEQTRQVVERIGSESKSAQDDVASLISNLIQDAKAMNAVMDEGDHLADRASQQHEEPWVIQRA